VQVWDATTGNNALTYRGHFNAVFDVDWSPDGTRIASASGTGFTFGKPDNTVQICQASTGTHLYTYTGHSAWLHTARWSPDGTRIASGGEDSLVKVWQAV
jgi:WD40 repeat protein